MVKDTYSQELLNHVNKDGICNAIKEIKSDNITYIVHNIFIAFCLLVMFFSIYYLQKNRLFFSIMIVLTITMMHFKPSILCYLTKMIINKDYI